MVKAGTESGEGAISLGTDAWNIADGFTKIKILRLLIQIDLDEELAMFGKRDDQDATPPQMIPQRRIESFEKMLFHLRQLIGNCKFSIAKGGLDDTLLTQYMERLKMVEEFSGACADWKINDITKENSLEINEDHFRKSFNILRTIKDDLNFPLNRASLIFRQSDEMDLDKIMRDIVEGG